MPICEYRCSACGFEQDALQRMADAPLVDCPSCGKPALVKLVSVAGFQLKGSGWYATDFKGSGSGKSAEKAKPDNGWRGLSSGSFIAGEKGGRPACGYGVFFFRCIYSGYRLFSVLSSRFASVSRPAFW